MANESFSNIKKVMDNNYNIKNRVNDINPMLSELDGISFGLKQD
jgi:hypothetical protein